MWVRRTTPSSFDGLSTSLNGLLILVFAWLAWRAARARDFVNHRPWAMRLYLVSNAQWFLRVGVFGYFVLMSASGSEPGFGDPFLKFWTIGCYLVPLLVLECYLRAQAGTRRWVKYAVAGGLALITLWMLAGMAAFAVFSHKLATGAPLRF